MSIPERCGWPLVRLVERLVKSERVPVRVRSALRLLAHEGRRIDSRTAAKLRELAPRLFTGGCDPTEIEALMNDLGSVR